MAEADHGRQEELSPTGERAAPDHVGLAFRAITAGTLAGVAFVAAMMWTYRALQASGTAPPARTPEKAAAAPKFPLQTYASLCAELALHPANRAAILSRYGIGSDAEHRAIDEEWRAPLLEPEQRQKWQEYYNTYSEWLRKQAR
ncbi:MAG TPA: hypothetical protein PKA50_11310 [Gemmatimonadales bacterium]|nr:hypothetical protein [Gemmatimonadales bacterium]